MISFYFLFFIFYFYFWQIGNLITHTTNLVQPRLRPNLMCNRKRKRKTKKWVFLHSNLKKNQIRKIQQVEFSIIFMSFFVFVWKNKKFQTKNRPVFRLGFQTKIVKRNSSINVTVEYRLRFSFSVAHKDRS